MKPFDLESAKAGKPVVTRCGFSARILCFDLDNHQPICAAISRPEGETVEIFNKDGAWDDDGNDRYDLFMVTEKRYVAVWLTDKGTAAVHPAVFASVEQLYAVMTGMTGVQIVEFEL